MAVALTIRPALAADICQNQLVIDFELDKLGAPLLAGQVIDDELAGLTVSASNTGGGPDLAIIFDSAAPTGGDPDLGTPNGDFGGPGVGTGGRAGMPGENAVALGKVLIIAEDAVDADMNGLIDDPDDEAGGGTITLAFADPVAVVSVDVLDIEETGSTVEARDASSALITSLPMLSLGDNSFQTVTVNAAGVSQLRIILEASGGLARVVYCPAAPTPTPVATATATATHTAVPPTATATASPTVTQTPTESPAGTATATAADTATATATAADTSTATATAAGTATATATAADTSTATATAADTSTATPTGSPSGTPVSTATATATGTATAPANCGNGSVDPGEACDDGNGFDGDGCDADCTISAQCDYAPAGSPAEFFVNDSIANDGGIAPAGCAVALFSSIQQAIDSLLVSDGDRLSVCPGAYAESVDVTKELAIQSTNGASVTSVTSADVAFDVRRSGVSIAGFTIEAATAGIAANSICPLGQSGCGAAEGSNLTVSDNTIRNSPLGVAWQSRIDCALVDGNAMTGNDAHVVIEQSAGIPAARVRIWQNAISGGGASGRSVSVAGLGLFASILGNIVETAAADGIVIAGLADDARLEENNIRDNPGIGVVVRPGAAGTRVRQNNIERNGTGLRNEAPEGIHDATLNWWGSQTGPFHALERPSAVGDEVVEVGGLDTEFIEFLCGPAPGGFPSVNGECDETEPQEELNFVAFGREPDVSPNGRFIVFVSDRDLNGDQIIAVDNSDGGDEVFLLNRKPGGKPQAFCLGGATPGALCARHRDCPADFDADPIVTEGVCVLLTQLSNDASGSGTSSAPRVTRNGNVFFATDANLLGTNPDGSFEVHRWSRRDYRKVAPSDPNTILSMLSDGAAGLDSLRPGSDRGGRRRVFMQSSADPLGTNGDGNAEILLLDTKKDQWTQITDTVGGDNLRPSTQNGRQVLFDSSADLTGGNPDGNREVFFAKFRRRAWEITQITDSAGVENRAGSVSKRGKIVVFSSDGNYAGRNADGNVEIFVWEKGVFEQITDTTAGENVNPKSNPRGRFVTFESTADVEDGGAVLTNRRVFFFDRKFGTTVLLSRSFFGDNFGPRISQGRFVVWESTANLTGQNPDGDRAIYLYDRRKDG